jgi:hypothetical protein
MVLRVFPPTRRPSEVRLGGAGIGRRSGLLNGWWRSISCGLRVPLQYFVRVQDSESELLFRSRMISDVEVNDLSSIV